MNSHEKHMRMALKEALKGKGKVSPNPLVGAVIVKNGMIIGKGAHLKFGENHAEVNAFNNCTESPVGADMYVTLEPCSHHGKTPPCTDRIIKEKISRVFIATLDPFKEVNGKGVAKLKKAGIKVEVGLLEKKGKEINEAFIHFQQTGLPFITIKSAISLDGSIATDTGDSKWISSEKSRKHVHKLRNDYDAVLVGKNTVLHDDPELTVRMVKGVNPKRIVIDKDLSLDINYKIFSDDHKNNTIILTSKSNKNTSKETILRNQGITILKISINKGHINLKEAMNKLGQLGITSIIIEGGGTTISSFLKEKLVNRINLFIAPIIIGSSKKITDNLGINFISDSIKIINKKTVKLDKDIFIDGLVEYN
ncbi:MAG: bifunctional diaminohydroxyphosphoribosylaminopyrimidine deaminase/5-amino-6-(5-phosphoribosylamino)uracil reductase RibD [Candidatus Delongbacteria bacterium]|jgi:diaminohydroxyphosphoribosylaminopyrimidine deaminase/5-amino-6-(5-phosphoribosylamino)uracil reductase|nr:bifunctional diaminohydroxyphosphoribosylaminopyrimidine deaminase/5-amino-6-(5-phosphoribosylamino)uracil reductase RibD [Candidatus Delongbacteria bacterium]